MFNVNSHLKVKYRKRFKLLNQHKATMMKTLVEHCACAAAFFLVLNVLTPFLPFIKPQEIISPINTIQTTIVFTCH